MKEFISLSLSLSLSLSRVRRTHYSFQFLIVSYLIIFKIDSNYNYYSNETMNLTSE